MAADCFGEDGRPVRGQVGELVVTAPWPGMTQGFWKDPQRYEETYWSRWPDVWVHGDWAYVDEDGFWFIQGRSDDTLKIAGKRLGPAEVESVLVSHDAVAEAGVVGVPHEVKGEAIVCFVVLRPNRAPSEPLRAELTDLVARQMGKALKPERVLFAMDLPKTRSAKIMRRVIRDVPGPGAGRPVVAREPGRRQGHRRGVMTSEVRSMLNRDDNELLTRTGPGTPMGALLRHYWIPVVLSSEVAAAAASSA